jgi:hypothetical protein
MRAYLESQDFKSHIKIRNVGSHPLRCLPLQDVQFTLPDLTVQAA